MKGRNVPGRQVYVDRDSVCMGDDVNAPNAKMLEAAEGDRISDVLRRVAAYLPRVSGEAIWAVDTGRRVLAYLTMDGGMLVSLALCQEDLLFSQTDVMGLHCTYFYEGRFFSRNRETGEPVEKYPECRTLLEKAERHMREAYFREELRIRGGSLRLWGEWFGRPHDNFHTVTTVRWERERITLEFREGEALFLRRPAGVINEETRFIAAAAEEITWTWYGAGGPRAYHNLYVRRYRRMADGTILRAEGKRGDVGPEDGRLFRPLENRAVCLLH